jgi:quinol monooxygenase YgiN
VFLRPSTRPLHHCMNHKQVAHSQLHRGGHYSFLIYPVVIGLAIAASIAIIMATGPTTTPPSPPPFSLFVTLTFTAPEHLETFKADIKPLCDYIKTSEPGTISYEVLLSDKNPLKVLVMERYKDKDEAFLTVHRSSAPFQEFRPKLKALQDAGFVTVDGDSFVDSQLGFGDRTLK